MGLNKVENNTWKKSEHVLLIYNSNIFHTRHLPQGLIFSVKSQLKTCSVYVSCLLYWIMVATMVKKCFSWHSHFQEVPKPQVQIVHFRDAQPPFVICMKQVSIRPCQTSIIALSDHHFLYYSTQHMQPTVSPSKTVGQTFRGQLSALRNLRDINWALLIVLGSRGLARGLLSSDMRDAPHEAFLARFASSDTREALSIFTCCVL